MKFLKESLRLDPDNAACLRAHKSAKRAETAKQEASASFKAGRYEEAVEKFSVCLEIDPNDRSYNANIYFNRAIARTKQAKWKEALADLE